MPVGRHASVPLGEITIRASRSSGPGGQHANVTASRIKAVFDVRASQALGEWQRGRLLSKVGPQLSAVAQDARSQAQNRELALERLSAKIAAALAQPRRRRPTKPTHASRERRLEEKRRTGERKRARRKPLD